MKKLLPALLSLSVIAAPVAFSAPALANAASRATVETPAPEYPRGAERRGIEGRVVLTFSVEADGSVSSAEIIESTPAGVFDRAAMAAVESWRFEPADARTEGHRQSLDFRLSN